MLEKRDPATIPINVWSLFNLFGCIRRNSLRYLLYQSMETSEATHVMKLISKEPEITVYGDEDKEILCFSEQQLDLSKMTAFDAYAALCENHEPGQVTAHKGNYPYDYVFMADNTILYVISFDGEGMRKIQQHNAIRLPENIGQAEHEVLLVVPEGYSADGFEGVEIKGAYRIALCTNSGKCIISETIKYN